MPFQNSIHNISAHIDLATQLLQIVIPTTFNTAYSDNLYFSLVLKDSLLGKDMVDY